MAKGILSTARKLTGLMSTALPFGALIRMSKQHLAIPFYHVVDDAACPHISPIYPVRSTKKFKEDLDFLARHFTPVDLPTLLDGPQSSTPMVHITFDDGLRQCHEIAAPILEEKGFPATFFLNSGFLDNSQLMYRYKAALLSEKPGKWLGLSFQDEEKLDKAAADFGIDFQDFLSTYKPYMSSKQVQDLLKRGFTIGAHSVSHPVYQQMSTKAQLEETLLDVAALREKFGSNAISTFAFPFSDLDIELLFFEMLQDEGISRCFGGSGLKTDIRANLPRFPMEKTTEPATRILRQEYAWYLLKSIFGRDRMRRS